MICANNIVMGSHDDIANGIRDYLNSLSQRPARAGTGRVVDKQAVRALKDQVRQAADPIDKAKLLTALEEERRGRRPEPEPENEAAKAIFVTHAREWAEAEGISATALQVLHVPDAVLKEAGFAVSTRVGSRRGSGSRSPRLELEDVAAAARQLGESWKLNDLAAAIDRDPATTRNYARKLIDAGLVKVTGDDPEHDGRGRPPKLYAPTS